MSKIRKWGWTLLGILVAFVLVALGAVWIYMPETHQGWVKQGVSQDQIPSGETSTIVFENVNIIPMDSERIMEEQTVVIENGRIAYIGPSGEGNIPANAHAIDGTGKFLIPGLSDMHMHAFGSENDLLVYLANGVTTIRILGVDPPMILDWRNEIRAGTRIGPSISAWWPAFESTPWEWEWGEEFSTRDGTTYIHSPEEAEQLVADMAALGVDGIKSHGVISSEIFLALQDSAAKHGLLFDGHVPFDHNSRDGERICDGLDCWIAFRNMGTPALAHVEELIKTAEWSDDSNRRASDESIQQIAKDAADDGLWVTTTLHLFRSTVDQAADLESTLAAMPEIKYVHPTVFDVRWAPGKNAYADLGTRPGYPEYLIAMEKMLLALYEAGAPLMSGTDAALPVLVPGFSLHDEFETMFDIGLPPYDVLKTSTYNPGLYLGELDEFGTIEEGKRADLVLLEANPLDDITNTRQIAGVMAQGRYFSRADLDVMLEMVAADYEAVESTQAIVKIAFPILVVGLLVGYFIQRRRASQDSS